MEFDTNFYIGVVVGGLLVGYLTYLRMKIFILDRMVNALPTPQEIAEEMVKAGTTFRIPVSNLPESMKNELIKNLSSQPPTKENKKSYIG